MNSLKMRRANKLARRLIHGRYLILDRFSGLSNRASIVRISLDEIYIVINRASIVRFSLDEIYIVINRSSIVRFSLDEL